MLSSLVDRAVEQLAAERGTFYLLDRDTGELCSRVAHLPELKEIRLPRGRGVAGYVAQVGHPVVLDDARDDAHFYSGIDRITGFTTRSMMAVPVRDAGGDLLGVLQVINSRRGRFSGEDQRSLEQVAGELGRALAGQPAPSPGHLVVGSSSAMIGLHKRLGAAAATAATVLLRGETGTGKTLLARAIHAASQRSRGPLIHVDCTCLPAGLIESELFGHERGAFTGADRQVPGKLELAQGGTLFLDEIGDLPLPLQGKLLRFLQDRELERVGGRQTLRLDVRVVAATNMDLEAQVQSGQFRRDLYYRIRVVELEVPPLRERGDQGVCELAHHFLERYVRRYQRTVAAFSSEAMARLQRHHWPGNVRELEHCIECAVVLCQGQRIEAKHLALLDGTSAPGRVGGYPPGTPMREVELDHIRRTLEHCGGNRSETATLLGIGRNTLLRKLQATKQL